jgi:NAD(P)-dependent dehydrogenase (short-subunit alcohol dehydrogenase family)
VDAAFAALGRIDVVVSHAALLGAAEELADEEVLRQLDTKMVGSIQLGHAVIPHLREQGAAGSCSRPVWAAKWPSLG